MLASATAAVAFGWTFGAALIALAAFGGLAPRGWTARDLAARLGTRRLAMCVGLALIVLPR